MNILEEYVKYCDNIDTKESKMDSDNDDYGFYCDLEDIPLSTHKKFVKIPKYTKNNNKNNKFIPINYQEHTNTITNVEKNFENKDYNSMKQRFMIQDWFSISVSTHCTVIVFSPFLDYKFPIDLLKFFLPLQTMIL